MTGASWRPSSTRRRPRHDNDLVVPDIACCRRPPRARSRPRSQVRSVSASIVHLAPPPDGGLTAWQGNRTSHEFASPLKRSPGSKRLSNVDDVIAREPADASRSTGRVDVAWPHRGYGAAAVHDLFRDHQPELVRLALLMVGDLATAEDVVQDAFEHVHHHWHGLRQPSSSLAYVRSCVLNGCRSVHRRAAVARKYGPRLAGPPEASGPDTASSVDDTGEIMAALRSLPRRQREVVVLRYYADLDVTEIAKTLRITPSGVRATISRALAALAQVLGEDR